MKLIRNLAITCVCLAAFGLGSCDAMHDNLEPCDPNEMVTPPDGGGDSAGTQSDINQND